MENIDDKTVAEIVTENIKTADVFKKNGIDFCCGGNVKVQEICAKKGVDYSKLKEDILNIGIAPKGSSDFNTWDLDFLTDYIINTHHKYVKEANELIIQYSDKVAKVHGHHFTETIEINKLFHEIANELNMHMQKEEQILFPFIKEIAKAKKEGVRLAPPPFGSIQNPINMMEMEHTDAGEILFKIKDLSNNHTPPEGACNTFKALYSKLEEYQNDLFQHIHLENNILFPKAIQFEQELM
ncbi:MAG: iron-sulfur cluster repair di-iron protein [Flavobacteriales bacterium]|nr:iron-sulfur cluster repair di-iron protein [Flavobacteriales bacterium]MCL4856288.1 iron-sulfur cluster repair di-iron protein [Flavobacteriales bacterium]